MNSTLLAIAHKLFGFQLKCLLNTLLRSTITAGNLLFKWTLTKHTVEGINIGSYDFVYTNVDRSMAKAVDV